MLNTALSLVLQVKLRLEMHGYSLIFRRRAFLQFIEHFHLRGDIFSKQGAIEPMQSKAPSYGELPNYWKLKYWLIRPRSKWIL